MTHRDDNPLARLADATEGLAPSDGFTDAIMQAVEELPIEAAPAEAPASSTRRDWRHGVVRSGRPALLVAAFAAAACIVLAIEAERSLDSEALATIDYVEVDE